ncbi:unnamed protein product, partial [Prorocentrum cordatum]
ALWIALEGVAQGPLARAASKRERGGRKGSRLSSVVSLNARPARESFAGASVQWEFLDSSGGPLLPGFELTSPACMLFQLQLVLARGTAKRAVSSSPAECCQLASRL